MISELDVKNKVRVMKMQQFSNPSRIIERC